MLVHNVQDAVEVVDAPRIRAFSAHRDLSLRWRVDYFLHEVRRHLAVVVVEIGKLRPRAIVWHARQRTGLVAAMRCAEPAEAVGEVLADAEADAVLPGRLSEAAKDVLLRPAVGRVPAGLVLRVPHVEVVVMATQI